MLITNIYPKQTNNIRMKQQTNCIKNTELTKSSGKSYAEISRSFYTVNFMGIRKTLTLAEKIQKERDEIFMLLNYSLIHKNWQTFGDKEYRGFNIGAILVNPEGKVVDTSLNSVWKDMNKTHHAEMNLMQNYLNKHPEQKGFLENFSIYTSLEPCAMCSGTMLQTGIGKILYGLNDPEYGGTIPRLLNKKSKKYIPYPTRTKTLIYKEASDSISKKMREQLKSENELPPKIVEWLNLDSVKELFSGAKKQLGSFQVKYIENKEALAQAKSLLEDVPDVKTLMANYSTSPDDWGKAISNLDPKDDNTTVTLKQIFEGNQKFSYILNPALDKVSSLGEKSKDLIPQVESLLDEKVYSKILFPTKEKIFCTFSNIAPENKLFLNKIKDTLNNPIDMQMHKVALDTIQKIKEKVSSTIKRKLIKLEENYLKTASDNNFSKIPTEISSRMQLSRTIVNSSDNNSLALNNFTNAFNYFRENYSKKPQAEVEDLIELHKLITKDMKNSQYEKWSGILRGEYWEDRSKFKGSSYTDFEQVRPEMKKFSKWLANNYSKMDAFDLAANSYQKLIQIHPFYDANGRTIRLFVDWILATKGYSMKEYPPNYDLASDLPTGKLSSLIKEQSKPIE